LDEKKKNTVIGITTLINHSMLCFWME